MEAIIAVFLMEFVKKYCKQIADGDIIVRVKPISIYNKEEKSEPKSKGNDTPQKNPQNKTK